MRFFMISVIVAAMVFSPAPPVLAQSGSRDILKQGLLGAGAGAVGGAASGAKGKDIWKGALAGAGVNIVGGALLDSISGEKADTVHHVEQKAPRDAYSEGYQDGYNNGYKQGYMQGYKDSSKEYPE